MPQGINTARINSITFLLPKQHFCLGAMLPRSRKSRSASAISNAQRLASLALGKLPFVDIFRMPLV
jgi:hypothetical protein